MVRVVSWNIRAGGGVRAREIAEAILALQPGVAVLLEFRGTPASCFIRERLAEGGLAHSWTTAHNAAPAANAVLVASRHPGRPLRVRARPPDPARWLAVETAGLRVGAVHIPNEETGRKWPFLASALDVGRAWQRHRALIVGDTNSGRPLIDEESPVFGARYAAWFDAIEALGWRDAFRHLHPAEREFTWYSPNRGNGFRIDQAFLSPRLVRSLHAASHCWPPHPGFPGRRDGLSDHAALVVDLD